MTTIKITELTNIGANLATSTVIPVVNMAGTPTTEKTVLGNIANVVLAGAGGNYVAAAKATTANTVTINAQPNITSTGNLIGLTVSNANGVVNFTTTANVTLGAVGNLHITGGTTDQLLTTDGAGNLSWTTVSGNGVSSELVNGNNSFVLDNDGNVVFEGNVAGQAVDRGLVWDYGANANGVNSTVVQNNGGLSVRAWTENGGGANGYSAPINIITNQNANTKQWIFDGAGNLTVPGNINSINSGGDLGAYITLTPDLGLARLSGRSAEANVGYTSTSWSNATYTGTQVTFTDAPDLVNFFNNNSFNDGVNQLFSINGGEPVLFTGYSTGVGNTVVVDTNVTADPDPTTVTSINFYSQLESYIAVDYDGSELSIISTGLTILIDNDQTEGPDIVLRSGDDITLQAKDMSLGSEREGGDINLNAGDGADDDGGGNTASGGGDIIIDAGIGGDGNSSSGGTGGFTQIRGGRGGTAGVTNLAGGGGYVEITGGDGGFNNSNTALGASGGDVNIYGGDTTREGFNGASVNLTSGAGGPNAFAGSVNISTPSSDSGPGGLWQFDGNGLLTLPDGAIIDTIGNNFEVRAVENVNFEANAVVNIYTDGSNNAYQWQFGDDGNLTLPGNTFAVNYANGSPVVISGGGGNTGNVTFDDVTVQGVNGLNLSAGSDFTANLAYLQVRAGDVPSHIHLDTGNNEAYDLIVGDDQNYVQVSSTGNILLSSYDSNTAQYIWTLDYNGNLILAGGNSVIQSIANSSLDPLNPNVSTMVLTPDPGYSTQALVLDPTLPGHIHLRAPGANIDEPSANIFLGGETSSFEVGYYNGAPPNLFIHSDNNTWTFDNTGNLALPGDIIGSANANFTIYSNAAAHEFIFGDDGTFYAPDNVVLGGNSIYIGPGANALGGIEHEVFIASSNLFPYVQAVVNNVSDNGSADWVALGAKGGDAGGQTSLGFTSSGFADANYTITGNGDGYVLVQSYAPGQTLLGGGGNLVLATGNNGTTKDIIFGTSGFLSSNIFGRISHANNSLELSRTGATITFPDATEQNTAWTGSVTTIANGNSNVNIATSNGNIVITSAGTNSWNFDSTGNLTIPGSSGGFIKTVSNASIGIVAVDNGTNNPAQLLSMTNAGAATSIISAYATNATIQTNATGTLNTWQFDNAGNLTLPTGGQIIVSGGLVSSGASPAPTINGFSITNSVGISGNGNIAGNNISATGNISGNTNGFTIGYLNIPQVAAANATLALTDAGKHYYSTTAGNFTLTVPLNSSVAFATGTAVSIVVQAAGNILVNAASGVTLYMAGNSTAANRVVGGYGMATLMKVATDTWFINGTGVS